jgi:Family of unknown function (DUF6455)
MKVSDPRSNGKSAAPDAAYELLDCRMEMLGLDRSAVESSDRKALEEVMRRCIDCGYREACAVDLKRDPNSPVWETYCPNASKLIELAETKWQGR